MKRVTQPIIFSSGVLKLHVSDTDPPLTGNHVQLIQFEKRKKKKKANKEKIELLINTYITSGVEWAVSHFLSNYSS